MPEDIRTKLIIDLCLQLEEQHNKLKRLTENIIECTKMMQKEAEEARIVLERTERSDR